MIFTLAGASLKIQRGFLLCKVKKHFCNKIWTLVSQLPEGFFFFCGGGGV